ncbi:MAG: hypothetical protein RIR00_367 [Pseudomonadota bacterium]|jgi:methyl-accepting chemotaxis protein
MSKPAPNPSRSDDARPSGAGADLLRIVRINEEIKSVVSVAFKINIMAMNAIFLAKRAGNAALGFGVLSNELRVFSHNLRASMEALTKLIHRSVTEVSVLLQDQRFNRLLDSTASQCGDHPRLKKVMDARQRDAELHNEKLSALRRELRLAIESAFQLVELGGVLAKSAKIEAAYGQNFAASLTQVSGEFDGIVEEIRVSLESLRKSAFFSRSSA